MMESKHNEHKDLKTSQQQSAVDDSEEEENEILEESPCGRWHKRREEVEQNNIPGIDATYLAMDTEEGVEVVWNEVRFSERKFFKAKEETISEVFDRLIQLEHPNIVKLHKYWIHKDTDVPKVVFITEYMSSGSLRQYFEKTKRHDIKISLQVWRRWCTQTLSALCYLHSSQPSIVHGNINCDTIFISYNGLIKIGAIAPDAIHRHVKTVRSDAKSNLHFIAPELGNFQEFPMLSPSVDIYSFGMCALEMAALEIPSDNDQPHHITDEIINKTIESLDNSIQRDFIQQCLRKDSIKRPTARDLLFHPIIFEVPTLRLFCAHSILNNPSLQPEQLTEEAISRFLCLQNQNDRIVAEIRRSEQQPSILFKQSDFPNRELEKLLDEVKNGAYPLTAVMPTTRPPLVCRQRTISPEIIDEAHKQINTPDNPYDEETRRIVYMNCSVQLMASDPTCYDIKIVIKLDDKINRQLTCEILKDQLIPPTISQELVYYGFINKDDKENVAQILFEALTELNVSNNNNNNYMAFCEKSLQTQNKNNHINNNSTGLTTTTTTTSSTITPAQIIVIQQQPNDLVCHHHHHHQQQQQYHQQQQNLISPDKNNEKTCDFLPDRFIIVETTNDNHQHHQMMMISPSNDNHSNDDQIIMQQQQNDNNGHQESLIDQQHPSNNELIINNNNNDNSKISSTTAVVDAAAVAHLNHHQNYGGGGDGTQNVVGDSTEHSTTNI